MTHSYLKDKNSTYHNTIINSNKSTNHGGADLTKAREASKDLVLDILKKRASDIDVNNCCPGDEDPFYVADLGEVYRQHLRWKMNLGRVKPFYGMFQTN